MRIREGFPGQRLRVLPADVVRSASASGPTSRLLVTDAGYFPHAHHHGTTRVHGTPGTIVIMTAAGSGACRVGTTVRRVTAGQALVVPAGTSHRYWADDRDPWTIWWLHARGPDATLFERELLGAAADGETGPAVVDVHDPVRAIGELERALEALETDETTSSLLRGSAAAWSVLGQLTADAAAGSAVRAEPVRAAQEYLRAHLDAAVQVGELAQRAGMSTSHFAALFRRATGGGVIEYVKRLRMARACELLITTAVPVADIGRAVGYDDPFYFSRQFRSVHDCSPSGYRARVGQGSPHHLEHDAVR